MNQRIYDLAGQAKFMAEEELNRQISYNAELKAFAEKFAELIVQECLEIVEKQLGGGNGDGVEWDRAIDFTYEDMKKHFGVGMSTEDKKTLIKELLGVKNDSN